MSPCRWSWQGSTTRSGAPRASWRRSGSATARPPIPREPQIIFADEPTGNLDTATGHAIIELIFARRAALGATLLIITHDPELADHCDRVVVMHDGRIEER